MSLKLFYVNLALNDKPIEELQKLLTAEVAFNHGLGSTEGDLVGVFGLLSSRVEQVIRQAVQVGSKNPLMVWKQILGGGLVHLFIVIRLPPWDVVEYGALEFKSLLDGFIWDMGSHRGIASICLIECDKELFKDADIDFIVLRGEEDPFIKIARFDYYRKKLFERHLKVLWAYGTGFISASCFAFLGATVAGFLQQIGSDAATRGCISDYFRFGIACIVLLLLGFGFWAGPSISFLLDRYWPARWIEKKKSHVLSYLSGLSKLRWWKGQ